MATKRKKKPVYSGTINVKLPAELEIYVRRIAAGALVTPEQVIAVILAMEVYRERAAQGKSEER